jgi:hypothetical protein
VFAIWLPMLAGDSRSAWDRSVLDDPRVVELWDGDRVAGRWFGDHAIAGLGGRGSVVWDAYFAFGPDSRWRAGPSGVLAAGSEIIGHTGGLEAKFLPLLR